MSGLYALDCGKVCCMKVLGRGGVCKGEAVILALLVCSACLLCCLLCLLCVAVFVCVCGGQALLTEGMLAILLCFVGLLA